MEQELLAAGVKIYQHQINDAGYHIEETEKRPEFLLMRLYIKGLGLEIGTGTNRLSPTVLGIDNYNHADADMVFDCAPEENGQQYYQPYPFKDERFDFVFSSHVLEDFKPIVLQIVFDEWLRLVKKGGYLILLVPDMEGKRYPDWDEVFTEEDEEVKSGKRKVNELKGNPSHHCTMGLTLLHKLQQESKYKSEIVCEDTVPHTTMTLDFVLRKL